MEKLKKLTKEDLGKRVLYGAFGVHNTKEEGVIKSFSNNSKTAWVVYKCNNDWANYRDYTGVPTNYCDLTINKGIT